MGDNMVQLKVVLIFSVLIIFCDAQLSRNEIDATVPKIIASNGYPVEKHRVKTEDGYILQMHRIPAGRRSVRRSATSGGKGKKAVLLVHGLLGSSGDFIIMGPKNSLSYILADAGYDVWLGNLRGNIYSSHQNLTRNDPAFWDYSFHEHGKYDATAMIDKVLNLTGLSKILYIGYSMGTTTFFTMMSERPEYNEKLVAFVALAPAVYMDNVKPLSEFLLKNMNISIVLRERGMLALGFKKDIMDFVADIFCSARDPNANVCMRFIFSIVGEDYEQLNWDVAPIFVARAQPASWKQLEHYGKIAMTGVFTEWMDGIWGEVKPYRLSNIRVPVSLLYGENDQLTEKTRIQQLAKDLNELGVLHSIKPGCPWPKFNHLDFIFAKDVGEFINKPLVNHLEELYNKYYKP